MQWTTVIKKELRTKCEHCIHVDIEELSGFLLLSISFHVSISYSKKSIDFRMDIPPQLQIIKNITTISFYRTKGVLIFTKILE